MTAVVATSASSGVTFDFPPSDCLESFFMMDFTRRCTVSLSHVNTCTHAESRARCTGAPAGVSTGGYYWEMFVLIHSSLWKHTSCVILQATPLRQRPTMILSCSCQTKLGQLRN